MIEQEVEEEVGQIEALLKRGAEENQWVGC